MNIRLANWAGEAKVDEAFKEAGLTNGVVYNDKKESSLRTLFEYFVFEKGLDFKVVTKRRKNQKDDTFVIETVICIDNKGFIKRNPHAHRRSGSKKNRGPEKEFGTKEYGIEEVLPYIDKRYGMKPLRKEFDGDMIKMNSLRLRTFKDKGCTCVDCGLEGTYFLKVRGNPMESWHFNLYGIDADGERILFTKDHIHPKSKGGPDSIDNMQTMCVRCNAKKGNKTDA